MIGNGYLVFIVFLYEEQHEVSLRVGSEMRASEYDLALLREEHDKRNQRRRAEYLVPA